MVLGHGHRRLSLTSNRSSTDEARQAESTTPEDEMVVEPDQGNVLSHIISQLRPGADLSRVVLPTFILEPRSMLERITNFMAHPETLLPMPEIDDPVQRFVSVVKFYLSGWHIKPPGVKKPLNPILGEHFTCYWDYLDHTRGFYIAEQTSHHPPKSSYFYMCPEHGIRIDGTLKPRSKFLGNSAASMMEGIAILRFLNRGKGPCGERYILTQPNMYARGILFGKMKYELGDHSFVRCPENNLVADIEFKTKGYFGGTYNAIGGVIRDERTQEILYELSGQWNGEMFIKNVVVRPQPDSTQGNLDGPAPNGRSHGKSPSFYSKFLRKSQTHIEVVACQLQTGQKDLLFDATHAKPSPPLVRSIDEQEERESQRLWQSAVAALKERNHEVATDEKLKIEERQRVETAKRAEEGVEWKPRLFRRVQGGPGGSEEGAEDLDWILNANIDGKTPEEQAKQILSITAIIQGQKPTQRYEIPTRESLEQSRKSHDNLSAPPLSHIEENDGGQGDDLIDFGNSNPSDSNRSQEPHEVPPNHQPQESQQAHPKPVDMNNVGHPQGLQEPLLPQQQPVKGGYLDTYQNDMRRNLPPSSGKEGADHSNFGTTLTRQDSETDDLDEFVDAQDGS